ncbi:MAG: MaoC family dehydratase N-terminal domain-containing protein [Burkholderiales bacterium]|nr:MaoC family dehydratase N-terminal domain-containing protein [Burkholderiales bacterium]
MTMKAPSTATMSTDFGRITEQTLAAARRMIGVRLRPEGPYIQDLSVDAIRTFCNGIGDLNPLYRDTEHGRSSRFGSLVAHPMFPMACAWIGRARWGFPGVHSFLGGNDWEFFRNLRPGDRISVIERVVGVDEKTSRFSGDLVIQYMQAEFANQTDDLVARVLGWSTRHERKAARDKKKYEPAQPYRYTDDEMAAIDAAVRSEASKVRGSEPRYWEDVDVGDELAPVVRGPLSSADTIGFLVACGRGHTHGLVANAAARHPGHFVQDGDTQRAAHTMDIHHRPAMARQSGAPGVIDFGAQRCAWLATLVTNWMGDAGVLKRLKMELRLPNVLGDTTWCKGKVAAKYIKDRHPLVEIDIWAENQRGQVSAPRGTAVVALPARLVSSRICRDGASIDLGYASHEALTAR